jgi:hypothetical protein
VLGVPAAKAPATQLPARPFKEAALPDYGDLAAVALAANHLVALASRCVGYDGQKPKSLAD